MDVDIEKDYFLYLNASETGYINLEFDDDYELVEVAYHAALFTNKRITEADIPKGMYCYHLRHDDDGEFCTLEKRVIANHAGSIVTKELIDLGDKEYIELDEDSSPCFSGENMSLYMFRKYDFYQSEDMTMTEV